MKRHEFIKNLLASGLAVVLPNYDWIKQYDKYYLLQCFVRGFKFYEGKNLLPQMKVGDMLELVREPKNEYDEFALALYYNKQKIGFVPSESNEILSKLIDIGTIDIMAEITHLETKAALWENVAVAIYVLKEKQIINTKADNAAYLTKLDTPKYYTVKNNDNTITRLYYDENDNRNYENTHTHNPDKV